MSNFDNSKRYLEGVILVRSSPRVFMTRLPQIQSPTEIPIPPYTNTQMGTGTFWAALPVVAVTHNATKGPMALLKIEIFNTNLYHSTTGNRRNKLNFETC